MNTGRIPDRNPDITSDITAAGTSEDCLSRIGIRRRLGDPILLPLLPPLVGRRHLGHRSPLLGLGNNFVDRLRRQVPHFHEVVGLDH